MIVVTFALPTESRDFCAALRHASWVGSGASVGLLGHLGTQEVLVVHTGVGPAAAARCAASLLATTRPEFLIAAGFAGGLDPRLRVADLVIATDLSAPALVARAGGIRATFAPLASVATPVESPAAKAVLALATGAAAVDLESVPLAAVCASAQVPFLAVRAISDPADHPLPVPFAVWFDLPRQRPRPLALLHYLLRHTGRIRPFAHFLQALPPARAALTQFLLRYLTP